MKTNTILFRASDGAILLQRLIIWRCFVFLINGTTAGAGSAVSLDAFCVARRLLIHGAVAWRALQRSRHSIPDGHASGHVDGKLESVTPPPPASPRAAWTRPAASGLTVAVGPSSKVFPSSREGRRVTNVWSAGRWARVADVECRSSDKRRLLLALISVAINFVLLRPASVKPPPAARMR